MGTWQVQEAKNRLSEVIEQAARSGPQIITRHGTEAAVVLSYEDYRRLAALRGRLSDFLRNSPLAGVDIDLERFKGPVRRGPDL